MQTLKWSTCKNKCSIFPCGPPIFLSTVQKFSTHTSWRPYLLLLLLSLSHLLISSLTNPLLSALSLSLSNPLLTRMEAGGAGLERQLRRAREAEVVSSRGGTRGAAAAAARADLGMAALRGPGSAPSSQRTRARALQRATTSSGTVDPARVRRR